MIPFEQFFFFPWMQKISSNWELHKTYYAPSVGYHADVIGGQPLAQARFGLHHGVRLCVDTCLQGLEFIHLAKHHATKENPKKSWLGRQSLHRPGRMGTPQKATSHRLTSFTGWRLRSLYATGHRKARINKYY